MLPETLEQFDSIGGSNTSSATPCFCRAAPSVFCLLALFRRCYRHVPLLFLLALRPFFERPSGKAVAGAGLAEQAAEPRKKSRGRMESFLPLALSSTSHLHTTISPASSISSPVSSLAAVSRASRLSRVYLSHSAPTCPSLSLFSVFAIVSHSEETAPPFSMMLVGTVAKVAPAEANYGYCWCWYSLNVFSSRKNIANEMLASHVLGMRWR